MCRLLFVGAALTLLALAPQGASAQGLQMGGTVASGGACPTSAVLTPGIGRYAYLNSKGGWCQDGSGGGGTTITGPLGTQTLANSVAVTAAINTILDLKNGSDLLNALGSATPAGTNQIGNLVADTHAQCAALCANLVLKASAGILKTFEVSADSTLSGAIWYVIVYDATAAPADGAITPAKCYQQASGVTQMGGTLSTGGSSFLTGIVIGVSSTGCFSKTASTHAFIAADFQ